MQCMLLNIDLNAQQTGMQIISNNLANINTNGLKEIEQILNLYSTKLLGVGGAQTSVDARPSSGFSIGTGPNNGKLTKTSFTRKYSFY